MPSLRLEDYVFRVTENQYRLFEYLNSRSEDWRWDTDIAAGTLTFTDVPTGTVLANCQAFLIGTHNNSSETWLWAWANPSVTLPKNGRTHFAQVKEAAKRERASRFQEKNPFSEPEPMALAVIMAGFANACTFYGGEYGQGTAFFVIEACPELETVIMDSFTRQEIILSAVQAVSFPHKEAIVAYLGEPVETKGHTLIFQPDPHDEPIEFDFDEMGRIQNLSMSLMGDIFEED